MRIAVTEARPGAAPGRGSQQATPRLAQAQGTASTPLTAAALGTENTRPISRTLRPFRVALRSLCNSPGKSPRRLHPNAWGRDVRGTAKPTRQPCTEPATASRRCACCGRPWDLWDLPMRRAGVRPVIPPTTPTARASAALGTMSSHIVGSSSTTRHWAPSSCSVASAGVFHVERPSPGLSPADKQAPGSAAPGRVPHRRPRTKPQPERLSARLQAALWERLKPPCGVGQARAVLEA